ncbi:hypothetical protein FKM82_021504, partial [Ascaphus truei]
MHLSSCCTEAAAVRSQSTSQWQRNNFLHIREGWVSTSESTLCVYRAYSRSRSLAVIVGWGPSGLRQSGADRYAWVTPGSPILGWTYSSGVETMAQRPSEMEDPLMYFILLESFTVGSRTVEAGRLCCVSEEAYLQRVAEDHPSTQSLCVTVLGESGLMEVDVNVLHPLSREKAALLLAVQSPTERLGCFLERGTLEQALKAEVGQQVLVEHEKKIFHAVLHHVGKISDNSLLPPVYFGVELEGEGDGKGQNDGSYKGMTFFKCKKNSGLFLPLNQVLFSGTLQTEDTGSPSSQTDAVSAVSPGDKVTFYVEDSIKRGIVMILNNQGSDNFVEVSL